MQTLCKNYSAKVQYSLQLFIDIKPVVFVFERAFIEDEQHKRLLIFFLIAEFISGTVLPLYLRC